MPCRASAFVEEQKTRNWTVKQDVENLEREKGVLVRKNRERKEGSEKITAALSAAEKEIAGLKQCKREWLAEKVALEEKASTVDTLEKDRREWLEKKDELIGRASTADALEAKSWNGSKRGRHCCSKRAKSTRWRKGALCCDIRGCNVQRTSRPSEAYEARLSLRRRRDRQKSQHTLSAPSSIRSMRVP